MFIKVTFTDAIGMGCINPDHIESMIRGRNMTKINMVGASEPEAYTICETPEELMEMMNDQKVNDMYMFKDALISAISSVVICTRTS